MKLVLVSLYVDETMAKYLLSSYVLKAYVNKVLPEVDVTVLNFNTNDEPTSIATSIVQERPDVIGYSCYTWNIKKVIDVINQVICGYHVLGGPEISKSSVKHISDQLDNVDCCFVVGEGEASLVSLLYYLIGDTGEPSQQTSVDINDVPSIYLNDIIPSKLYRRKQAFLETQRGCKFRCSYCVYHKGLPNTFYYHTERIHDELDHLIINSKVSAIRIFDATLTSDLDRAKGIIEHLIYIQRQGNILPWIYWEFVYQEVDEEFIQLVSKLKTKPYETPPNSYTIKPLNRPQLYSEMLKGYTAINCTGIQSFNPKSLRAVNRLANKQEDFLDFMGMVKQYRIVLKMDLILGLPCETVESYFQGLDEIMPYLENTDHILNVHLLQILPGSRLESKCDEYGLVYRKDAPHHVISTNSMTADELKQIGILTGILFRIVNSPLRGELIKKWRGGVELKELLWGIYVRLGKQCVSDYEQVGDEFWNRGIFKKLTVKNILDCLSEVTCPSRT